jgi:glycosyltransferase involved in cell wall biosynthesis
MRILVLSHEFPPVGGGGGRVALDLCRALAARGHELCVITSHLKGLARAEMIDGVRVIRVECLRRYPFRATLGDMLIYDLAAIATGLNVIRGWRPDLIHAHFAVPAGAAAYVLSALAHIPYALTIHLGDVPGAVPEKTNDWFRWMYPLTPPFWRSAARRIAVSEYTRSLALENYPLAMDVILNGVDLEALPARQSEADRPPRLIFAARFVPQKNPEHVVQALAQLKDLAWDCVMLGDGPLHSAVQKQIEQAGLADRFTLTGWVAPDDVLKQFARGDILLLPSRSEGLPVVGVQAMAMGLALALSRVGGNVELVEEGANGFLFAPGDISAFVLGLRRLLSDADALRAAQIQSLARAHTFDLRHIADQYEQVFRAIISPST